METHPNPSQALSDGPNAFPLGHLKELFADTDGAGCRSEEARFD